MLDPRLIRIEELYDANLVRSEEIDALSREAVGGMLAALDRRDFDAVERMAVPLFESAPSEEEKAFILQWAVASAEIQYDLKRRAQWVERWNDIPGWIDSEFCRYLHLFQQATLSYFDGCLKEAESRFRATLEMAEASGYRRGVIRSLLHLGLVHRYSGRTQSAISFFEGAAERACAKPVLSRLVDRIDIQLEELGKGSHEPARNPPVIPRMKNRSLEEIIKGRVDAGRRLLATAERERRRSKLNRRRESLPVYFALGFAARGRGRAARRLYRKIQDPLLRIFYLESLDRIQPLSDAEKRELAFLRTSQGNSWVAESGICGIKIEDISNESVRKFAALLLRHGQSESIEKAVICRELWGFEYDPISHDPRIYKLVMQTRRFFGRKDLFLNTYGGYRINPKYVGGLAPTTSRVAARI